MILILFYAKINFPSNEFCLEKFYKKVFDEKSSVESRANVVVIVNKIIATYYYEKKADGGKIGSRGKKVRTNEDVIEAMERRRMSYVLLKRGTHYPVIRSAVSGFIGNSSLCFVGAVFNGPRTNPGALESGRQQRRRSKGL